MKHSNPKEFFESLNSINAGLEIDNKRTSSSRFHPLDAEQRRMLKRQRKAEKRARRAETRHHRDKFSLHPITPLTENQTRTFNAYRAGKHLLLHGYAGTGKTFISLFLGLEDIFNDKGSQFKKVVTIRSVVPSRDMGYLPGSALEKQRVYEEPYMEICDSLFGEGNGYNILKDRGLFEFTTTSFLRGVTFTDSIVIVDEMQNMTFQELDTVMTRIGENCRIIFCGDFRQTDLDKDQDRNGLHKFMAILHKLKGFEYIEFGREDIVRSSIVKDYIIARTENEDRKAPKPSVIPSVTGPTIPNWINWPPGSWLVGDISKQICQSDPAPDAARGPHTTGFLTTIPLNTPDAIKTTTGQLVDEKV